jgi:hypothetical protein
MKTINYVESHKNYNLTPADKYDYGLVKDNGNATCCAPMNESCSIF